MQIMAAKKISRKKTTAKSSPKRAGSPRTTVKKVAHGEKRPAKRTRSSVSKVSRRTKQVAQGAQKVGKIVGVIGNLVEAGGKAAEDIAVKVESGGRKRNGNRAHTGQSTRGSRKKDQV
jgi:hypothetical protein